MNSVNGSGRYSWSRVKSNRHKLNKVSQVSDDHLVGRLCLLELDAEEIAGRFPKISDGIAAEIALIETELAARARGKRAKPPVVKVEAPFVIEDFASLADLEFVAPLEDDTCEI